MGIFNRRRGIDRQESPKPTDDYLNLLTKYDEKYILPTDNAGPQMPQQDFSATTATATMVGDMQSVGMQTEERPMVFVMRENKDIFVYEYSDRLEYYLKTDSSMYKFHTVKK
ncbi:MAG: hypothetical protein J1G01_06160 [Clostridiales bacterium]|nr:hypothetical protein [Clostridiales bacterium]